LARSPARQIAAQRTEPQPPATPPRTATTRTSSTITLLLLQLTAQITMIIIPFDPQSLSFVLPVSTRRGIKTLRLESIWRARDWRGRVQEIREVILKDRALEIVEVSYDAEDFDRLKIFEAVLRHHRVKEVKFHDGRVDSHTFSRLLDMDNIERLTFSNTHFEDAESIALVMKMNSKKLKCMAFHWIDGGAHENAVMRSSHLHSSLKTLAVGFLDDCSKLELLVK
jgi:hypothetical protein